MGRAKTGNVNPPRFEVILRRANGRFVKSTVRTSKFSAKRLQQTWEDEYDDGYYVEVVPLNT